MKTEQYHCQLALEHFYFPVCDSGYYVMVPSGNGSAAVCALCRDNTHSQFGAAADIEGCNSKLIYVTIST